MKRFVEFPDHLKAVFEFDSFIEAIDFINQVADISESHNHHPDIHLHDYNLVTITLSTHEKKAVTSKDWQLAQAIQEIAS